MESINKGKLKQKGLVIWLFGLSGAGKTTISSLLKEKLEGDGFFTVALDGDVLREGLNKDLSFSEQDRRENIRRAAEFAKVLVKNNIITICSFITPLQENRASAAGIIGENYFEVFIQCPLSECIKRDVKGLYKKAKANQITNFTGISANFETPEKTDLIISTLHESAIESMLKIYDKILPQISFC